MSFLLEARNLAREYRSSGVFKKADPVRAVDGVSLRIQPGETLGIVGESGCGKSTLGRMLLGIDDATEGQVLFEGKPLPCRNTMQWRRLRAQMQLVFQDPLAALDRRLPIAAQIGEPLHIHGLASGAELKARVEELMQSVGLR
ncbi:MAG: ATP-binding cassette domain-containing protein, partial [Alphaproteobacteria bacterium]